MPLTGGRWKISNLSAKRWSVRRRFTAVPGYGGIFMGVTAIAAAYIANNQPVKSRLADRSGWSKRFWLSRSDFLRCGRNRRLRKRPLTCAPAKKFAMSFLPPDFAACSLLFGFWRFGHFEVMIPVWILLYGAAVVCGGAFSVKAVPILGWCFIALGALAFFIDARFGNLIYGH